MSIRTGSVPGLKINSWQNWAYILRIMSSYHDYTPILLIPSLLLLELHQFIRMP